MEKGAGAVAAPTTSVSEPRKKEEVGAHFPEESTLSFVSSLHHLLQRHSRLVGAKIHLATAWFGTSSLVSESA
jgi:hypothetical protein